VEATRKSGVRSTRGWNDLIHPNNGEVAFTPAMPLKKGHLAMLMASGLMGTLRMTDNDGHPMLVKGLGIERPKLRNTASIANHNTLNLCPDKLARPPAGPLSVKHVGATSN
jgi:hypothetical protein